METVVLPRRIALAAMVAVGLLADAPAQASAQSPGSEGADPQKPTESGAPKAPEGTVQPGESGAKPPEGSAQKPGEDATQKLRLVSILGREVTNREGDGGRIIDVLVDLDGRSGAVVVEFGGFMGIGSRKVAVDWSALRFVRDGNRTALVVNVSREQIRHAAEYKANEPPNVLTSK
jgi:hypothetical protein